MVISVQKNVKSNESNDKVIRRFVRACKTKIKKLKTERYFKKDKTRRRVRAEAIKKEEYRAIKRKKVI